MTVRLIQRLRLVIVRVRRVGALQGCSMRIAGRDDEGTAEPRAAMPKGAARWTSTGVMAHRDER